MNYTKNNRSSITFTGKNKNIYYLEVVKKPVPNDDFSSMSLKLLNRYSQIDNLAIMSDAKIKNKTSYKIRGYQAVSWNFDQAPKTKRFSFRNKIYHEILVINFKEFIILAATKKLNSNSTNNTNASIHEFAQSISLLQNTSRLDILSALP